MLAAVRVVDPGLVRRALAGLGQPRVGVGRRDHRDARLAEHRDDDLGSARVERADVGDQIIRAGCLGCQGGGPLLGPGAGLGRRVVLVRVLDGPTVDLAASFIDGVLDRGDDRIRLALRRSLPRQLRPDLDGALVSAGTSRTAGGEGEHRDSRERANLSELHSHSSSETTAPRSLGTVPGRPTDTPTRTQFQRRKPGARSGSQTPAAPSPGGGGALGRTRRWCAAVGDSGPVRAARRLPPKR